jgi:acyl-coenzyme A synthetase/AMP-(fatty) acid ligase
MALASVQGSSAEAAAYTADGNLLDIYWQVAETTHPTAKLHYARLAAFLAFVGVLTAALAVMISLPEAEGGPIILQSCMALGAMGLLVSVAFSAHEVRARRASGPQPDSDAAEYTTSGIYHASAGFFAFVVVISAALLLVR